MHAQSHKAFDPAVKIQLERRTNIAWHPPHIFLSCLDRKIYDTEEYFVVEKTLGRDSILVEDQNASLQYFLLAVQLTILTGRFSTTMAMLQVKTQEFGLNGTTGFQW